jgi:hypothetical protein
MKRRVPALLLGFLLVSQAVYAQQPSSRPLPDDFLGTIDARATRQQFAQLLRRLPPNVGEVLERDPSLLTRGDYLDPYPVLVQFLEQHPEIAKNPYYFVGGFQYREPQPRDRAEELFQVLGVATGGLAAGVALLSVFVWLVRNVIEHRRWLRASRVQAEVHSKIMDRLTTNEELMAYVQSPAGRRFLEAAPVGDARTRGQSAPVNSILWSLQGGVVLVALGVGMWFVQDRVIRELAEGFFIIGVIAAALGGGFIASALMSYKISARMGLVDTSRSDNA